MAYPVYQDVTVTRNETAATSFSVNMPGTISVGDLLLAIVSGGSGNGIEAPAGWTLLRSTMAANTSSAIAYRVADGTEAGSYTFTFTQSRRLNAVVVRISGVDTADPIDDWAGNGQDTNNATHTAASANSFGTERLLVSCAIGGWHGFSYTPPSGVTERADSANTGGNATGSTLGVGTEQIASSGATGTREWACSASLNFQAINVLVRPSGAAARDRGLLQSQQSTVQSTASTTFTLNLPSGVAEDDLLVAVISGGGGSQTITPPGGWTAVQTLTAYTNAAGGVYSKVAGASEPSSYNFTFSESRQGVGECLVFRGTGVPAIDVSAQNGSGANSTNLIAPTVTPTVTDATLVTAVFGGWGATTHLHTPAGHIKIRERETHLSSQLGSMIGVGIEAPVPDSATGTRTWTAHSGIHFGAVTLAIVDAAAPNAPPVVTISTADAQTIPEGSILTLTATAIDAEDGDLSAGITWSSNLDGPLGTGASIDVSTLSVGVHTITASRTDSGALTGTDSITVTVTGATEDGTLPAPTIEVGDPTGDTWFAVTITSAKPATAIAVRFRAVIDGGATITTDALLIDPDDVTEAWRTYQFDGLTLGDTGDAYAGWVSADGVGPWSTLAAFALLTEAPTPDTPDAVPGGEVLSYEMTDPLAWPWPTYRALVSIYDPEVDGTKIRLYASIDGDDITTPVSADSYPHPAMPHTQNFDFLTPGGGYQVSTHSLYVTTGYRESPERTIPLAVPQALAPPRFLTPAGSMLRGTLNLEWFAPENLLEPGTDRVDYTRDNGTTWTLLIADVVPNILDGLEIGTHSLDTTALAEGPIHFRVRRESEYEGDSVWRVSPRYYIDNLAQGFYFAGADLTLDLFDIIGSSGEAGRWSEEEFTTGDFGLQRVGTATTAGYLALKPEYVGSPRTLEVTMTGQFATSDGSGNSFQYTPDMQSHFGVAAYAGETIEALSVRFRGLFGANGYRSGQAIGQSAFSAWNSGRLLGQGIGELQVVANTGDPIVHGQIANVQKTQWNRNNRHGDPRYQVIGRYEQEERYLDGSARYRIYPMLHGPDNESSATFDTSAVRNAVSIPCGTPALSLMSASASTVRVYSFSAYPEDYGDCAIPLEYEESEPGRPCALLLQIYAADGVTIAHEITTDHTYVGQGDAKPYLMEPSSYGEQEVDFATCRVSIGQVNVSVIDPRQIANDQDSGWMTERLIDVAGRRNRLRRFISTEQGWVTIADGPGSFPRLRNTFAGYEWSIRDTRERERRLRAFVTSSEFQAFPRGLVNGFEQYDYGWLSPPAGPAQGYHVNLGFDLTSANPRRIIYLENQAGNAIGWGTPAPAEVPAEIVYSEAIGKLFDGTYVGTPAEQEWTYPEITLHWRAQGSSGAYTEITGITLDAVYWENVPTVTIREGNMINVAQDQILEGTDGDDPVLVQAVRFIKLDIHDPATQTLMPAHDTDIEFYFTVSSTRPTSEEYPFHVWGLTAGEFLINLYNGLYSPRDSNGDVIPTGIRYDEAALLEMTATVTIRVTKPVDDIRAWSEKNIYAPLGYAPALDSDGRISPASQEIPDPAYVAIPDLVDNNITAPVPGHTPGDNVINLLVFDYKRGYLNPLSGSIDGLSEQEVTIEYPNPTSIERHGERKLEIETVAFMAVGNNDGRLPLTEEAGWLLALERDTHLADRRAFGTDLVIVPVMREPTAHLRVGDWVHITLTWIPNQYMGTRNLNHLAQILAVKDLNCAWREFTFELVQSWPI